MSFAKLIDSLNLKLKAYGYRFLYDMYQLRELYNSISWHINRCLPFSISKKSLWKCINSSRRRQKYFEILARTIAETFDYKIEINRVSYDFIPRTKPLQII